MSQKQVEQTKAPFVLRKTRQESKSDSASLCLAFYVFNSDKISNEVSAFYSAYAEGELLKALSKALEPRGRWMAISSLVQACHGDLFEESRLPGLPVMVRALGNWLGAGTYGIKAAYLDSSFISKLESSESLGFIPAYPLIPGFTPCFRVSITLWVEVYPFEWVFNPVL